MTSAKDRAIARYLKRAMKFGAIGAVALGAVAFAHVAWDAHKFAASGRTPVDDARMIYLTLTVLGAIVGGALGTVLGTVVEFVKGRGT